MQSLGRGKTGTDVGSQTDSPPRAAAESVTTVTFQLPQSDTPMLCCTHTAHGDYLILRRTAHKNILTDAADNKMLGIVTIFQTRVYPSKVQNAVYRTSIHLQPCPDDILKH